MLQISVHILTFLIHEDDLQSRPVVITIFALSVCTSVRPFSYFSKFRETNQLSSENSVITTGGTVWVWPSGSLTCFQLVPIKIAMGGEQFFR